MRALRLLAALAVPLLVSMPGVARADRPEGLGASLDEGFGTYVVAPLGSFFFFDVIFWDDPTTGLTLPFIVLWLIAGAMYLTARFAFINVRAFGHAIAVTRGRYDDPNDPGEVSHFQALSSALSATVGLGNIGGVALAVGMGGPGAVFWMAAAGFFGMSSKFTECTLGTLYRESDEKGHVLGGPMLYLGKGLASLGWPRLGKALAIVFALMCIGGSFGGGNMFQANQSYAQVAHVVPGLRGEAGALVFGVLLAALVGAVILGGIRRIGAVAGVLVPGMCLLYLVAGIVVLLAHADRLGDGFAAIFREAFTPRAELGGLLGVLVVGVRRASFSNEAGVGSASIAHAAAATDEPVREGIVALLEPFIDTIVVCTITGLVVVVSGAYHETASSGVVMTSKAFETVLPWFPAVLAVVVLLFAYSTMISWSYYGERCWTFLFGAGAAPIYKLLFLLFVVLGAVFELQNVVEFSDLMILGMAFPNMLGLFLLSGRVRDALNDYWRRFRGGSMAPDRP